MEHRGTVQSSWAVESSEFSVFWWFSTFAHKFSNKLDRSILLQNIFISSFFAFPFVMPTFHGSWGCTTPDFCSLWFRLIFIHFSLKLEWWIIQSYSRKKKSLCNDDPVWEWVRRDMSKLKVNEKILEKFSNVFSHSIKYVYQVPLLPFGIAYQISRASGMSIKDPKKIRLRWCRSALKSCSMKNWIRKYFLCQLKTRWASHKCKKRKNFYVNISVRRFLMMFELINMKILSLIFIWEKKIRRGTGKNVNNFVSLDCHTRRRCRWLDGRVAQERPSSGWS